jgi:ribosomal protein S18 acetylase RimI-like enzyme
VVRIDPGTVTAARRVPPGPPRPGWHVPQVSAEDLQRICWAGWPAREVEMLGDWALRAHGGITGRANSAMAIGDPGVPLAEALSRTADWYAARDLQPLLQLPLADPANREMADRGWAQQHVTIVEVAPIEQVVQRVAPRPELTATVTPTPSADWLSLMHDLDPHDPQGHVAILTGPPVVGFVTVYEAGAPLGIGRVSVEGQWAGVTSVDVAPKARRRGIGSAVMRELLRWAAQQGAVATFLQVRAANDPALRLYARLGYLTHHPYTYRAPASP